MKPMLAKKFEDHKHKLNWPCYVQPKLNGVRMLYTGGICQSRDQHFWRDGCLTSIRESLAEVPNNILLDGELYRHGMTLQAINSAISVNRLTDSPTTDKILYNIFDCILLDDLSAPFDKRMLRLTSLMLSDRLGPHAVLVHTHLVSSEDEADYLYNAYKKENYEGLMYRQNAPYGITANCGNKENRWDILLKRKDWLDEDCEIIEIQMGTGKYSNCVGSLLLRFPANGATFSAGSGLSDMQRREFTSDPPIGRLAKIKYEILSDDGLPLKPTIECIL